MGWGGGYDQLCCPASPKLLLGLDLGLGCDNFSVWLKIDVQDKDEVQIFHATHGSIFRYQRIKLTKFVIKINYEGGPTHNLDRIPLEGCDLENFGEMEIYQTLSKIYSNDATVSLEKVDRSKCDDQLSN